MDYPFIVMPRAAVEADLSDNAFRVLSALLTYKGEDGCVFPSVPTLAKMLKRSKDTIRRGLKELVDAEAIQRSERYRDDGGRTSDNFVFSWDRLIGAPPSQNCDPPPRKNARGAPRKFDTPITRTSSNKNQKNKTPSPNPSPQEGGDGPPLVLEFPKPPPAIVRHQLKASGFTFDQGQWVAQESPQSHLIYEQHKKAQVPQLSPGERAALEEEIAQAYKDDPFQDDLPTPEQWLEKKRVAQEDLAFFAAHGG